MVVKVYSMEYSIRHLSKISKFKFLNPDQEYNLEGIIETGQDNSHDWIIHLENYNTFRTDKTDSTDRKVKKNGGCLFRNLVSKLFKKTWTICLNRHGEDQNCDAFEVCYKPSHRNYAGVVQMLNIYT